MSRKTISGEDNSAGSNRKKPMKAFHMFCKYMMVSDTQSFLILVQETSKAKEQNFQVDNF